MSHSHPTVSEQSEGKPWFEWCMALVVVAATLLASFGYMMAATVTIAAAAIISGVIRLIQRDNSPWKIRSVVFDAVCGIGFGVILLALYLSILLLNH